MISEKGRLGLGVIFLIGIGGFIGSVWTEAAVTGGTGIVLLGPRIGMAFSVLILLTGFQLWRSELSSRGVFRALAWCLGFTLGGLLATLFMFPTGASLMDPSPRTFVMAIHGYTTGATMGILIGYYDAVGVRRRQDLLRERRKLESKKEELEIINRLLRHDIRNDLTVIRGWGEELKERVDDEERETIDRILNASGSAIELTTSVRNLVDAIVEGKTETEPVNLKGNLLPEITKARNNYTFADFRVKGEIPETRILGGTMLRSVFRNILNNAVQHNDKERPEIVVTAEEGEDCVTVSISDNGPGIPATVKEDLFEKGAMSPSSTGTGIGLYLVENLIEQYEGEVWVEDNEPEGAIFKVKLQKV